MRRTKRLARPTRWLVWSVAAVVSTSWVARRWNERTTPAPASPPRWPPFDPPAPAVASTATVAPTSTVAPGSTVPATRPWVAPVDGRCPADHPVKANDNSGIFHLPGGRSYERTRAERCYVDAVSAAADGYRAAKA